MGRRKRKRNKNAHEQGASNQSSGNSNASTSSGSNSGTSTASSSSHSGHSGQGGNPQPSHDRRNPSNVQNAPVRPNVPNQQQNMQGRPSGRKLQLPPKPQHAAQSTPRQDVRPESRPSDAKPPKKNDERKVDDAWEEDFEASPLGWQFKIGAIVLMALLGLGSWVGYQYFFGADEAGSEDKQVADNETPSDSGENEGEEPPSSDEPVSPGLPTLGGSGLPILESPPSDAPPALQPLEDLPLPSVETADASPEGLMPWEQVPLAATEPGADLPPIDTPTEPSPSMTIPNASEITDVSTPAPPSILNVGPTELPDYSSSQPPSPGVAETVPPMPLPNPTDLPAPPSPEYASQPEIPPYGERYGGYGGYGGVAATRPNVPVSRPPLMTSPPPATPNPRSMYVEPGSSVNMAPIASPGASQPTAASYEAVLPPSLPPSGSNEGIYRQYTVMTGDTLFSIAERQLGERSRWVDVFILNKDSIVSDPNRLRPGTTIRLPAASGSMEATVGRGADTGRGVLE